MESGQPEKETCLVQALIYGRSLKDDRKKGWKKYET